MYLVSLAITYVCFAVPGLDGLCVSDDWFVGQVRVDANARLYLAEGHRKSKGLSW
jgi:hypothetical protein